MENTRLYKWALWLTAVIGLLGFIFSYMTLLVVAQGFNMNPAQVVIFPLLLDLLMVVSHLVYFYFRTHGQDARKVATLMYGTVVLSVAFNLSHASWDFSTLQDAGQNARAFLNLAAWALPPVALLACVKMISGMVAIEQLQKPQAEPVATPAQDIAITEAVQVAPVAILQDATQTAKPQADAKMPTAQRRKEVAKVLRLDSTVSDAKLAEQFAVDPSTIYRDRKALQNGAH